MAIEQARSSSSISTELAVLEEIRRALRIFSGAHHQPPHGLLTEHPSLEEVCVADFQSLLATVVEDGVQENAMELVRSYLHNHFSRNVSSSTGAGAWTGSKSIYSAQGKVMASAYLYKLAHRCRVHKQSEDYEVRLLALTLLQLIQRLFYEAQALFIDTMLRSAKLKYLACKALADALLADQPARLVQELAAEMSDGSQAATHDAIAEYLQSIVGACDANLLCCSMRLRHDSHLLDTDEELLAATRAERLRRVWMMLETSRLHEAQEQLALMSQASPSSRRYVGSFISGNSNRKLQSLSQLFLSGICLPAISLDKLSYEELTVLATTLCASSDIEATAQIAALVKSACESSSRLRALQPRLFGAGQDIADTAPCAISDEAVKDEQWQRYLAKMQSKLNFELAKLGDD
jgi:hypothetical protein